MHAPKPPQAPDPVLLAAMGHGGKITNNYDAPTPTPSDSPQADEGITPGTIIGGLMIYEALTTDYGSPSDTFSGDGGSFGGGGASGSFD